MKKIVFTGGGTLGHVMPSLALIPYLSNYEIHYIGGSGIEKEILAKYPTIIYHEITTTKLRRNLSLSNLTIPIKLLKGVLESKKILSSIKPSVVFSKGGFVSVPVSIASHSLHIPLLTHESDISMGLANKIISHFADKVLCSFSTTMKKDKKYVLTGSPIRRNLKYGSRLSVRGYNTLSKSKKNVLIFGGSLGAKAINDFVFNNIDSLTNRYNIILITGKGKKNGNIKDSSSFIQIEYADNISDYFDMAHYVVSRAGSNAIFELLSLHKKALLIPLTGKSSRGEQLENAKYFSNLGYVELLEEKNLTLDTFLDKISKLDHIKPSNIDIDKTNLKIIAEIKRFL